MKWFSYILRHGMIIVLVIGISIAYVYRQQLFPKFFQDEIQKQADTEESKEAMHAESSSSQQAETLADKSPVQAGAQHDVDITMQKNKEPVDDTAESESQDSTESDQYVESTSQDDQSTHAEDTLPAMQETEEALEPILPGKLENTKKDLDQSPQIPSSPKESINNEQSDELPEKDQQKSDDLQMTDLGSADTVIDSRYSQEEQYFQIINNARHAFWQGQHDVAITRYEQAILHLPASVEAYGELGNVYYSMGQWDKSGENLYQAAIRLVDVGQIQRAQYLLSVISGLKPARVKDLEKKLSDKE